MPMHYFKSDAIGNYLTQDMLTGLNVTMPNNDGTYSTREEFIEADDVAKNTAEMILSTISTIINNKQLPNIQKD